MSARELDSLLQRRAAPRRRALVPRDLGLVRSRDRLLRLPGAPRACSRPLRASARPARLRLSLLRLPRLRVQRRPTRTGHPRGADRRHPGGGRLSGEPRRDRPPPCPTRLGPWRRPGDRRSCARPARHRRRRSERDRGRLSDDAGPPRRSLLGLADGAPRSGPPGTRLARTLGPDPRLRRPPSPKARRWTTSKRSFTRTPVLGSRLPARQASTYFAFQSSTSSDGSLPARSLSPTAPRTTSTHSRRPDRLNERGRAARAPPTRRASATASGCTTATKPCGS